MDPPRATKKCIYAYFAESVYALQSPISHNHSMHIVHWKLVEMELPGDHYDLMSEDIIRPQCVKQIFAFRCQKKLMEFMWADVPAPQTRSPVFFLSCFKIRNTIGCRCYFKVFVLDCSSAERTWSASSAECSRAFAAWVGFVGWLHPGVCLCDGWLELTLSYHSASQWMR